MRRTCLLALLLALAAPAAEPMRDEDVVRMLVRGDAVETILAAIERRPTSFDLSPEMLDELRLAGLSDQLIRAMQRRQQAQEQATRAPSPETVAVEAALLIHLAAPSRIVFPAELPASLAEAWELREPGPVEDVAVFLACRTPRHVPDHWRAASPLGRDFHSMPRHGMLAFVGGAETGRGKRLVLELTEPLRAELAPDVEHDVALGVALRVGGHYYRVQDAEALVRVETGDVLELAAHIETKGGKRTGVPEIRLAPY